MSLEQCRRPPLSHRYNMACHIVAGHNTSVHEYDGLNIVTQPLVSILGRPARRRTRASLISANTPTADTLSLLYGLRFTLLSMTVSIRPPRALFQYLSLADLDIQCLHPKMGIGPMFTFYISSKWRKNLLSPPNHLYHHSDTLNAPYLPNAKAYKLQTW